MPTAEDKSNRLRSAGMFVKDKLGTSYSDLF